MQLMNNKIGVVNQMRKIRDKMSSDIMGMNIDQERKFIQTQLSELKSKNSFHDKNSLPL